MIENTNDSKKNIVINGEEMFPKKDPDRITLLKYYEEFAANTSLHGVKYTRSDRSIATRIWWAVMVIFSFYICGYLIQEIWNKWDRSPVIVSFAETSTPIWQIPFPAITICPTSKFKKAKFNYAEVCINELNSTEDNLKLYDILGMMCFMQCLQNKGRDVDTVNVSNLELIIDEYCVKEDAIFITCVKDNEERACKDLFTPIITDQGLCFTYNMLSAEDIYKENVYYNKKYHLNSTKANGWTMENGYPKHEPVNTYPNRGIAINMDVFLKYNVEDVDFRCNGIYRGFQIVIHAPNTIPNPRNSFVWAPVKLSTIITVKPQMMTSSKAIKKYSPKSRGCYFSSERKLKFFKEYTQNNCNIECLTDYVIQACGCVPYYMPRFYSTPICSTTKFNCVIKAGANFQAMTYLNPDIEEGLETPAQLCNCLPSCISLEYDFEMSQVKLDWGKYLAEMPDVNLNNTPSMIAAINIGFKVSQFISSKRSELYGITDFMANCGGLIGVCTGFSILSIVEIFYFFVIRLLSDIRKKIAAKHQINAV